MVKQVIPQTFARASIGGRRYSRAPTDVTAPTVPILSAPVPNTTFIDLQWVNGVDAETGIRETRVEYRLFGSSTWIEFDRVEFPGASAQITGLTPAMAYEVAVTSFDNAGNASARVTATVSTLSVTTGTEPGTVAVSASSFTVAEGVDFEIDVTRTGAGVNSPAIEADWTLSGFSEGTPSPQNGTLTWAAGANGAPLSPLTATAGDVTASRTGTLRIVAVRALSGTVPPSLGTALASLTIIPAAGTLLHYDDFQGAAWDAFKQGEAGYSNARWAVHDDFNGLLDTRGTLSTNRARVGTKSLRFQLTNPYPDSTKKINGGQDWPFRNEGVMKPWPTTGFQATPLLAPREYWYCQSIYLPGAGDPFGDPQYTAAGSASNFEIFWQWHDAPDANDVSRNPMLSLRMVDGGGTLSRWGCQILSQSAAAGTKDNYNPGTRNLDFGSWAADVGHWTDWVFRVRFDYNDPSTKGLFEAWKNGTKVYSEMGRGNCYNDSGGRTMHLGLYRARNAVAMAVTPARRVWYVGWSRLIEYAGNPFAAVDSSNPAYISVIPPTPRI